MDNTSLDEERIPEPGQPFHHEHPDTHFERRDARWGRSLRDWGILLVMILIYLSWTLIIYFFEPGIR